MLHLTQGTQILIAVSPVDFRRQIDGLIAICQQKLLSNPHSGQWFIFINRSRTMIRILCYEQNGYWLATKRLSRGRFRDWPKSVNAISHVEASTLVKLLNAVVVKENKKSYINAVGKNEKGTCHVFSNNVIRN